MGHQVVIEGSRTPSVDLPHGERRKVEVTTYIRRLVQIGAVIVVEGSLDPPASERKPAVVEVEPAAPEEDAADEAAAVDEPEPSHSGPPAGNASTQEWLAFLRGKGIPVPVNGEGETPGREGLKTIWQQASSGR
jgi:hypothetical protein